MPARTGRSLRREVRTVTSDSWLHRLRLLPAALVLAASLPSAGCLSRPGPPDGPQDPKCLERAVFGNPADSLYVLPYPAGKAYEVFQTYCGPVSHGRDGQMAIDFLMPSGSEVVAARSGVVRRVDDRHGAGGRRFNYIYLEHEDGTSSFYGHLLKGSARVKGREKVDQGQVIALSGSSGTTLEHLHFGVASTWPIKHPDDLPVNFRNSDDPLDGRGGLQRGVVYRALPEPPPPV